MEEEDDDDEEEEEEELGTAALLGPAIADDPNDGGFDPDDGTDDEEDEVRYVQNARMRRNLYVYSTYSFILSFFPHVFVG